MSGRSRRGSAFTIIELLVVIGIIAILVALLLPSLNLARNKANQAKCMNNVRQIGLALQVYLHDYNELPPLDLSAPRPLATTPEGQSPFPVFFAARRSGLLALRHRVGFTRNHLACPDGWASTGVEDFYETNGISRTGTAYMDYAFWPLRYPPSPTFDVRFASLRYRHEKARKVMVTDIVADLSDSRAASVVGRGNHGTNHLGAPKVVQRTDGHGGRLPAYNRIHSVGSSALFSDYSVQWFAVERLTQQANGLCYPPVDQW